jgi:hypothetical protein
VNEEDQTLRVIINILGVVIVAATIVLVIATIIHAF